MSIRSANGARWGLLITTAVMAVALVATGLSSYLGARRASVDLVRARAVDLGMLVRRSFRFAGFDDEALQDVVDDAASQGLRGLALLLPGEEPFAVVALDEATVRRAGLICTEPGSPLKVVRHGEALLLTQPLRPGGRPGRGRPGRGRWGPPDGPGHDACLVLALDAEVAAPIVGRALTTLLVSLVGALLLLGVAAFFWRASRRAELLTAELNRDRQLKMLGEMSAVLGHELRNPLASLKGHAQLVLEKLEAEHGAHQGATRVVDEAKRLERLTGEILAFARVAEPARESCEPASIARAAVAALGDERIHLDISAAPARWSLDPHRMQQVLGNLLRNALQSSDPGARVELTVALDGERLLYSVRDHGPGIPPDELDRIFEPFVTDRVRGTGLGLAISRRIVESHGGTIDANNHARGGALFVVRLPAGA